MSIVVCQEKNTYLHYFIFPLNFPGLLKSEGGQANLTPPSEVKTIALAFRGPTLGRISGNNRLPRPA